jgi:hypothetical protein
MSNQSLHFDKTYFSCIITAKLSLKTQKAGEKVCQKPDFIWRD